VQDNWEAQTQIENNTLKYFRYVPKNHKGIKSIFAIVPKCANPKLKYNF
jgi:hypothetical protein